MTPLGFPDSSVGKESARNAEDPGLIPGLGRSSGEGISLARGPGSVGHKSFSIPIGCCFWPQGDPAFFFEFFVFFFHVDLYLKSLLYLLQYCFYFMFWIFGHKAYGTLVPQPGIKPPSLALGGEVLTT